MVRTTIIALFGFTLFLIKELQPVFIARLNCGSLKKSDTNTRWISQSERQKIGQGIFNDRIYILLRRRGSQGDLAAGGRKCDDCSLCVAILA